MAKTKVTGLESFLGKTVTLFCGNYFYTGTLEAIGKESVELSGAKVVFDTGAYDSASWQTAEALPKGSWHVTKTWIESFGDLK